MSSELIQDDAKYRDLFLIGYFSTMSYHIINITTQLTQHMQLIQLTTSVVSLVSIITAHITTGCSCCYGECTLFHPLSVSLPGCRGMAILSSFRAEVHQRAGNQ